MMNKTLLYKYIDFKPGAKRYIVPDVHGCFKTLRILVEEVMTPSKPDQIFFLGDYIDRGPDSGAVIDYILNLKEQGYEIYALRGNHEESILKAHEEYDADSFAKMLVRINKCPDLLDASGALEKRYLHFMSGLPYYFEMDDCYLVHAGFDYKKPEPFKDYSAMIQLYIENEKYDVSILNGKKMIHGHRVTAIHSIREMVNERKQIISLDNGCAYYKQHKIYDYKELGHLCCLELNSFVLHSVKNIDMQ